MTPAVPPSGLWAALRSGILSMKSVPQVVTAVEGAIQRGRISLFSVFRDEAYFCPAFFDHYRRLGVEQFVILDDGSTDGTAEFLRAQPDCVVLTARLRFGDPVLFAGPGLRLRKCRAGVYFKVAVPQALLPDEYVTYVDADEFLLLPPGVDGLGAVIDRLRRTGEAAALASVAEFFPERPCDAASDGPPADFAALLAASPYFEPEPVLALRPDGSFAKIAPSKSQRLFRRHRLGTGPDGRSGLRSSPRHKTPVLLQGPSTVRRGAHDVRGKVSPDLLLCLAHFVFTPQWKAKIDRARAWKAHSYGAEKYDHYARLHDAMVVEGATFLGPNSKRYAGPEDLSAAGLVKW